MTPEPSRWTLWLPATFALVIVSFFAATAVAHWQMLAMDRGALEIARDVAPTILDLTEARSEIRHLQVVQEEDLDRIEHGIPGELEATSNVRRALDDAVNDYLVLPASAGEKTLRSDILRTKDSVDRTGALFEAEIRRADATAARSTLRQDCANAASDLNAAIVNVMKGDAIHAQDIALEIGRLRTRSTYIAFGLDFIATVIAVAGAARLSSVMQAHAALAHRHAELEKERASELEQFAGRVAHDVSSPLGAASIAMELSRRPDDDDRRKRILDRGLNAIHRVKRLVDGLLAFARAGAIPDPDAQADLEVALQDVATELLPAAADAGIELRIEHGGAATVRCHPGILTSLILNLGRNAIKYMGGGPVRRIDIRTVDRGANVRVEVEDTGPGLAPDIEGHAFEPYTRARGATQPGIGLGLATVRRLAEAHHGRVGVSSTPGRGCRFWFELPKVTPLDAPRAADTNPPTDRSFVPREGR